MILANNMGISWFQLVPAVTELVVAELMYLQWMDPKEPIYLYINSTGTTRDDGETVRPLSIELNYCLQNFYKLESCIPFNCLVPFTLPLSFLCD